MSNQRSRWQIFSYPRRPQPRSEAGGSCNAHPVEKLLTTSALYSSMRQHLSHT
jgi:hypothetical protein